MSPVTANAHPPAFYLVLRGVGFLTWDPKWLRAVSMLFGVAAIWAFWLVGHSQGGMTSRRLLHTDYFAERVDGWLSLSGGRIGAAPRSPTAGPPSRPGAGARQRPRMDPPADLDCDFSFIFSVGEHEIASLPKTSPWAEKYRAGPRIRLPDVVDTEPGQIYDTTRDGHSTKAWGL